MRSDVLWKSIVISLGKRRKQLLYNGETCQTTSGRWPRFRSTVISHVSDTYPCYDSGYFYRGEKICLSLWSSSQTSVSPVSHGGEVWQIPIEGHSTMPWPVLLKMLRSSKTSKVWESQGKPKETSSPNVIWCPLWDPGTEKGQWVKSKGKKIKTWEEVKAKRSHK